MSDDAKMPDNTAHTPNYLVTVVGHPDSPFRVYDPTIGVLAAAMVRRRVRAGNDDPYTMRTEIEVARLLPDGTSEPVHYCEGVSIHDDLAEARQRAMAEECEDAEKERQRIEAAADELQRIADSKQTPDARPGHYYVSAVDGGTHWFPMAGPFLTHQEALDLVDDVRRYAHEVNYRSVWYSFGTCRVDPSDTAPTGKITLEMLTEARQRWSEVEQAGDEVTAPHKMAAKRKRASRDAVAGVASDAVAASIPLRKLSDLPSRDR
jgi:hypothetical protein